MNTDRGVDEVAGDAVETKVAVNAMLKPTVHAAARIDRRTRLIPRKQTRTDEKRAKLTPRTASPATPDEVQ